MKISMLIKKLDELKRKHGNLDVCISREDLELIPEEYTYYMVMDVYQESCLFNDDNDCLEGNEKPFVYVSIR